MSDTAANEGQGATRSRRLVTRALFVLGGALAGTAAAWLVSSATASADTVEVGTSSVAPVTEATTGDLGDVNNGVSDFSGQAATAWSEPDSSRVLEHEVSERVSDSVSDFADDAVVSPAHRTLGAVEHIVRKPEDTRQVLEQTFTPEPAHDVWQLLDPAGHGDLVPSLPGLAPVEQAPVSTGVGQATDTVAVSTVQLPAALRAALVMPTGVQHDDSGAAGESRDGHRDLPSPLVPVQLPVAPSVPTAPGGSSAPGGHLDGLNFGVPFWTTEAVDSAVAAMSRAGLRTAMRTPGEQPGVTPD
ncbi:hypothetical protein ACIA5G_08915 [Amycolatopsis sp. NPDC051758]|uniref:hypothetical protein n=1 Tax=Amycolatopsis sp. NPDC051758 TaxID=3363935 RepID=UPI003799B2B2